MAEFRPHEYQNIAIEHIKTHAEAAVLLDMGLGKTAIALSAVRDLLARGEVRRVLVIAPLRVARDTWTGEAGKWGAFASLHLSVAVGTEAERRTALLASADVYVINRENVVWLVEESGIAWTWDMVVIDELSSFKSGKAKRFLALLRVRPRIKRIVGLSGTPAPNGLMDLWAEFRLLDGGARLGKFIGRYRADYFVPDARNGQVIYSYKPRRGAEQAIYRKIGDITISMKSTDYLPMPELVSSAVTVRLSAAERARYERLRDTLVLRLAGEGGAMVTAANAATLAGKLAQLANGAVYDDSGAVQLIHERKLDALEDLIEAANGKPLLVAYWYRHDLARIAGRLSARGVGFAQLDSAESMRRWNAGELAVGLIHPASAGHGLNLQSGGSALAWFGLTWSLELYQQTVARLWRQGQTARTVTVQHIVTGGTMDERMLTALASKDATQSALLDAVRAELRIGTVFTVSAVRLMEVAA